MNHKRIRRILALILVGILVLGIAACGKTIGTGNEQTTKASQEATKNSKETASSKKDDPNKKETTKETEKDADKQSENGGSSSGSSSSSSNTGTSGGGSNSGSSTGNSNSGSSTGNSNSGSGSGSSDGSPQPQTEAQTVPPSPSWTISVTVDGGAYGGVFASGTYTYYYEPTAYDALVSTGLSHTGSGYYVSSINGLAEKEHGRYSGWLYSVNGTEPNVGCGSYYLNDGDSVYWHYQGDE